MTPEKVLKAIKKMKNKKSAGSDELAQEQMILGAEGFFLFLNNRPLLF